MIDYTFDNSNTIKTIDIKSFTTNWNFLNNNNFLVALNSVAGSSSTSSSNVTNYLDHVKIGSRLNFNFSKSFDNISGNLTISISISACALLDGWDPRTYNYGKINITIYLIQ